MKLHTGDGVGQSIISMLEEFETSAEQFQGGSFDGQYFHLSVPDVLNTHFGTEGKDGLFTMITTPCTKQAWSTLIFEKMTISSL